MDHSNDTATFNNPQSNQVLMADTFDDLTEAFDPGNSDYFDLEGPISVDTDFPWSSANLEWTGNHLGEYDKHSLDGGNSNSTATETGWSRSKA